MAKGDNNKAAGALGAAADAAKDAAGAVDAALKADASAAISEVKGDAKQVGTEAQDLLDKAGAEVTSAESSAETEEADVARDFSRGFGLLAKVQASLRTAGSKANVDAEKALSELHDAVATLVRKIEAAGEHVEGDLRDFLAELKAHL